MFIFEQMDEQGFVKIDKLLTFKSLKNKKCGAKEIIEVSWLLKTLTKYFYTDHTYVIKFTLIFFQSLQNFVSRTS